MRLSPRAFLAAAAVLAAAGLAAPPPADPAPRKLLVHYQPSEAVYDRLNLEAARSFMAENPDVEVKMLFLPDSSYAFLVRTMLASGRQVDSICFSHGQAAQVLAEGSVVPIIPRAFGKDSMDAVRAMWTPGAIEICGGSRDGRYYGIPFELSNYVAWINTADMREAGLDPARDKPKTWDQFVEVARRLTKVEGGVTVRSGFMCNSKLGVFNFLVLAAMMEQLGLDWGTEQGLASSMDQPEVLERGLKTYTDFVTASRIWDPSLADDDRPGFGNHRSSMFLTGGTWYWGFLDSYSVKRADVQPFPYPRFPGGRDIGGVGYGYCLYVTKQSRDPELAFRFLDEMASQPNEFIRHGFYQPRVTLSDGSPALDPGLARRYIPYYDEVFKGELLKTSVWLSSTSASQVTWAAWQAITRVIYRGVSVEDSVAALQRDIRALFPDPR